MGETIESLTARIEVLEKHSLAQASQILRMALQMERQLNLNDSFLKNLSLVVDKIGVPK